MAFESLLMQRSLGRIAGRETFVFVNREKLYAFHGVQNIASQTP